MREGCRQASRGPHLRPLLALACLALAARVQADVGVLPRLSYAPVAEGSAVVSTGSDLLFALQSGVGDITLANNIQLQEADWIGLDPPIILDAPNSTILIHSDDPATLRVLDWGYALGLISVTAGTTLALDGISSQHPGNRTKGVEELDVEIKGSALWPTVTGESKHKAVIANGNAQFDIAKCNPSFVQFEVQRIQKQIDDMAQTPGLGAKLVTWEGGVTNYYVNVTFPAALFNTVTKQQEGRAIYSLLNLTSTCYDSSPASTSATSSDDGGGGGGTPSWVWAVVGSVLGCAALALVAAAFLWRRKRRLQAQLGGGGGSVDEEGRLSKSGSASEGGLLAPKAAGALDQTLSGRPSGQLSHKGSGLSAFEPELSGQLHSQLMRARFGPIDGVQLGELLGRGAYGRVYRGRWKGAMVAVKVIDHRVQPGKTYDLSREPLLSMGVSHPNVVITHKMCVVKVTQAADGLDTGEGGPPPDAGSGGSSGGARGSGGGALVPAIDGRGGLVEIVSPHDVLQPGLYETWLVCEYCDKGSLADLLSGGRLSPDPAQRDIWAVLCLLDVALGLSYLHSSSLIHGDLKPANVMLKAARNDRRGFVRKLGDFGLSRMLGQEESHVDTTSYGTASYAAPELLTQGKLTKAADIYSLGIIMWELSAGGQELYPGLTAMQVILQVSQHGTRPDLPATCPEAMADLMQRCWHADAAQRPSAEQVVEELRQQLMALRPQPGRPHGAPAVQPAPPAPSA